MYKKFRMLTDRPERYVGLQCSFAFICSPFSIHVRPAPLDADLSIVPKHCVAYLQRHRAVSLRQHALLSCFCLIIDLSQYCAAGLKGITPLRATRH